MMYEKPKMIFKDLRNEQAVAGIDGPCLAAAASVGGKFYYDVPGDGWISIITPANCSAKIDQCTWTYQDNPNYDGEKPSQEVIDKAIADAKAAMDADKQEFSGAAHDPDISFSC